MNTNGIVCSSLYGFTLLVCLLTYWRVKRRGPRGGSFRRRRKLVRVGLVLSALTLTVYLASRLWEFGFAGDVIRIDCSDGWLCLAAVNETASQGRLQQLGWHSTGWYWTDNTSVNIFFYRLLPFVHRRPNSFDSIEIPVLWMFLTVLIPSWIAWHSIRRVPPGHCSECRYDLTGNVSGICPECGTAIKIVPNGSE